MKLELSQNKSSRNLVRLIVTVSTLTQIIANVTI